MNEKARVFEQFLIDEKLTCFEKREVGDEDHTVVFRSYVQIAYHCNICETIEVSLQINE